ncbi:PREDICTED: B-cell receptor CD22-like [Cyprinodon variegatus]|uniref:B-cell receptor CD22-like n=1 Tax=Cyprinodon variegatus TaxID=28743 RepID=UPI000742BF6E|nr:PREDICTED: B-cell receptor CD22-like [Cyprinodon variegatus]
MSDSVNYKFRFITNQPEGALTGLPGVALNVTDLRVKVRRSETLTELKCESSCGLTNLPFYVWYNKGQVMGEKTASVQVSVKKGDRYSCSVKGNTNYHSPSVYAPKLLSVMVRFPDELTEGRSVMFKCNSEANPAAKYTWKKENNQTVLSQNQTFVLSSVLSVDSGQFYCTAENDLGERTSKRVYIDVKYAPRPPSVKVTPSSEIMEGSLLTLTCSSDANPEAKYTWYKEREDSPTASGPNFTISSIIYQQGGNYYCQAQNIIGSSGTVLNVKVVPGNVKSGCNYLVFCCKHKNIVFIVCQDYSCVI